MRPSGPHAFGEVQVSRIETTRFSRIILLQRLLILTGGFGTPFAARLLNQRLIYEEEKMNELQIMD